FIAISCSDLNACSTEKQWSVLHMKTLPPDPPTNKHTHTHTHTNTHTHTHTHTHTAPSASCSCSDFQLLSGADRMIDVCVRVCVYACVCSMKSRYRTCN